MLFSPYSPHSAIPVNAGCQNLLLPHSSSRLTVSMPSSPVSGISEPSSSKKDSQAYIVRKANPRKKKNHISNIFHREEDIKTEQHRELFVLGKKITWKP
jgi:hypothetical protein